MWCLASLQLGGGPLFEPVSGGEADGAASALVVPARTTAQALGGAPAQLGLDAPRLGRPSRARRAAWRRGRGQRRGHSSGELVEDRRTVALSAAICGGDHPVGGAIEAEHLDHALRERWRKAFGGVRADAQSDSRLDVVASLTARPGGAGIGVGTSTREVVGQLRGRQPPVAACSATLALSPEPGFCSAWASSSFATACSRVISPSWPRSRFQITKPQPGFLRLFQLVQP